MSKPHIHAQQHAKKYGGEPDDYVHIDIWMDQTKRYMACNRHRILHTTFGIDLCAQVFGETFARKSDGKTISTRQIAEDHILQDFRGRFIPTLQDFLEGIPMQDWMMNASGNSLPPSARALYKRSEVEKFEMKD